MGRFNIEIMPERCTGCLRCQLACSELYTKAFNPLRARLQVVMEGLHCTISFSDECSRCGVCADHCLYGALAKTPKDNG
jgi:Fe-S-cluster-containing dehydrogenase component